MSDKLFELYQKYNQYGFSEDTIKKAYNRCKNPDNSNLMIDTMIEIQNEGKKGYQNSKTSESSQKFGTQSTMGVI
jgi:hypothetical protein